MPLTAPEALVSKYREGMVSREELLDYAYKKEHPRSFRFRKRVQNGLRRWRRRRARFMDGLPVPSLRALLDPDAIFAFGKPFTVVICLVLSPYTVVALSVFWSAYALAYLWRAPLLAFLDRRRALAHAELAASLADCPAPRDDRES